MRDIPPHATVASASSAPIGKVTNPAIVTMGGVVLSYVAKQYFKIDIPAEVALAIVGLLAYLVAYLTPIKRREVSL
jgi:hypothetical protein